MISRILLPLDGSRLGEAVVPYVSQIAISVKAPVTLLHVELPAGAQNGAAEPGYLDKVAESLSAKGLQVETATVCGDPPLEILHYLQERWHDCIAMSTHGRSGLGRWVYGSVTEKVLHACDAPLLLVRPTGLDRFPLEEGPLRHLIVPLDGSQLAEGALPPTEALAGAMRMEITLLRVVPPLALTYSGMESYSYEPRFQQEMTEELEAAAGKYLEGVRERLTTQGFYVNTLVASGHPASQIIDLAQQTEGSLVVMSTHGRSGLSRWILGSVADRVLRASRRPVYLVRSQLGPML